MSNITDGSGNVMYSNGKPVTSLTTGTGAAGQNINSNNSPGSVQTMVQCLTTL